MTIQTNDGHADTPPTREKHGDAVLRCRKCKFTLVPGATKCPSCSAYQNWQRFLGQVNLLSVLTNVSLIIAILLGYRQLVAIRQDIHDHLLRAKVSTWVGLIENVERKVQMAGINFLGPLHDTREELLRLLGQRGTVYILLLDMESPAFRDRENKEGRRLSDGLVSKRLRAESEAAFEIIKDINMFKTAGTLELRTYGSTPEFAVLIADDVLIQYNEYPRSLVGDDPSDVLRSRGTEGVVAIYHRGDSEFSRKKREFDELWQRGTSVDLSLDPMGDVPGSDL